MELAEELVDLAERCECSPFILREAAQYIAELEARLKDGKKVYRIWLTNSKSWYAVTEVSNKRASNKTVWEDRSAVDKIIYKNLQGIRHEIVAYILNKEE